MTTNDLTIRTAADAITFAAPLLGFVPTNSIVIYCLRDGHYLNHIMRFDALVDPRSAANVPATTHLATQNLSGAILLGIADEPLQQHTRHILDVLRDALQDAGIPALRRLLTHAVDRAGTWTDPDTGETGPTLAYTDTILAVTHPDVAADRDTAAAAFEPTEPPAPIIDATNIVALVNDTVEDFVNALNGTRAANPALATGVGVVITGDTRLRDALIRISAEAPQAAAKLWTELAGPLRGPARVYALTIAAIAYYLTGDGPRAGMALDAAFDTVAATTTDVPDLTAQIDSLLQSGTSPDVIRRLLLGDDNT